MIRRMFLNINIVNMINSLIVIIHCIVKQPVHHIVYSYSQFIAAILIKCPAKLDNKMQPTKGCTLHAESITVAKFVLSGTPAHKS